MSSPHDVFGGAAAEFSPTGIMWDHKKGYNTIVRYSSHYNGFLFPEQHGIVQT
jgi:hypothetical protein